MMIPGALEPRTVAAVNAVAVVDKQPTDRQDGNAWGPDTGRPELPSWLKVSIFAATLVAAMWLWMAVF